MLVENPEFLSHEGGEITLNERSLALIELIVDDNCFIPEIRREHDRISVVIGLNHDFDNILDLCGGVLTNDEITLVHKLWADDNFPRTFTRQGQSLIIRARD